ncbi:MAG: hypothetical protein PHC62_07805 [Candidatus Izemoplasmatales bacterium]|nr:hypothetical protein [Candidatus Izemoplasmatales bacterium]
MRNGTELIMTETTWLGIFLAVILTLVIEVAVYWIRGYKDKDFYIVVIFINIATNLSLNLSGVLLINYLSITSAFTYLLLILFLEVCVYFAELIPLSKMTENKKKIRYSVLYANLISMIFGTALMLYI